MEKLKDFSAVRPNEDLSQRIDTEAVLTHLHRTTESAGAVRRDTVANLHNEILSTEQFGLFDQYIKGEIPTLERMFERLPAVIELALENLHKQEERYGTEAVREEKALLKLLSGREKQIKYTIGQYIQSVIRFNTLREFSKGGARDVAAQFSEADKSRRRIHNQLLDSLSIYLQTIITVNKADLFSEGGTSPFVVWERGMNARDIPEDKIVLFSSNVLSDRDFIRDWAIAADFAESLSLLNGRLADS